jgi:hypothetical protein
MPQPAHLKSAYAVPRLAPDQKALAHNIRAQPCHFAVECSPNANGKVGGSVHLTGPQIAQMLGQTSVDFAHLKKIEFKKASTNIAVPMGGHFTIGNGQTSSTFATPDREMFVSNDGALTACHLVVPPSCGAGTMASFSDLGEINTEHVAYGTKEQVTSAIGRSLRWSGQPSTENFSGNCLKVTNNNITRYLVPTDTVHTSCAMSTLFGANVNKAGFCDGRYSDKKATFATDPDGRKCRVVTGEDFATVSTALKTRLAEGNPLRNGITLHMESFNENDAAVVQDMTDAGFTPRVSLSATFHRDTTEEFMRKPGDGTAAPSISRETMHELIGESMDSAPVIGGVTSESFADTIMKLSLDGEEKPNLQISSDAGQGATLENGTAELNFTN